MSGNIPSRTTIELRRVLNELLRRVEATRGKQVGEIYLGSDVIVARLRRPKIIEGQWEDLDRTVDLLDLIDEHQQDQP